MPVAKTVAASESLYEAFQAMTPYDPDAGRPAGSLGIWGDNFFKPIQDEVFGLISRALLGGFSWRIRNTTGGTLNAGTLLYPTGILSVDETGDSGGQLATWVLFGVTIFNSDKNQLYWKLTNSGTTRTVTLYKDVRGEKPVATGTLVGNGTLTLAAVVDATTGLSSGISGTVAVTYTADDTDISANILTCNLLTVAKADGTDMTKRACFVLNAALTNNTNGVAHGYMDVSGLDTSGAGADGSQVYLSEATPGTWQYTSPSASNVGWWVGTVLKKDATLGSIRFFPSAALFVSIGTSGYAAGSVTLPKLESRARPINNFLLNAGFDLFQRQAPGTATSRADDAYGADRWNLLTQSNPINVERSTGDTGSLYAAKLTQANAVAQRMGQEQIVEGRESIVMRGRTIRAQLRIKCSSSQAIRIAVLEWTGTRDTVTSDVVNDWTSASYTAGNFFLAANLTVVGISAVTPGAATWTALSITGTVSANCNNLIVFVWTEGTAAQNVTLETCQAMLVDGVDARDWLPRSVDEETTLCSRFYQKSFDLDTEPKQNAATELGAVDYYISTAGIANGGQLVRYSTPMRAVPTITTFSPAAASAAWYNYSAAGASGAATVRASGQSSFTLENAQAVGDLAGHRVSIHWSADAEL